MLPTRLRHLLLVGADHPVVHPGARERPSARRLGLRDLVLVVREDEVRAAGVDREVEAEQLLGHRRALDVPSGPALAPRRRPGRVLALLARLPEREVEPVALALAAARLLALVHLVGIAVGELSVAVEAADGEVDVAVGLVGVAGFDQRLDQRHDLGHGVGRPRLGVGASEAEPVGVLLVEPDHLGRVLCRADPGRGGGLVDLVVDVGDVDDDLGPAADVGEVAPEQHRHGEGARVADVDPRVDGRPAGVDPDLGVAGRKGGQLAAKRVLDPHVTHRADAIRVLARPRTPLFAARPRGPGSTPACPACAACSVPGAWECTRTQGRDRPRCTSSA